jgi:transposase
VSLRPYANDLRRRMVAACESNAYSHPQGAELCGVSVATVRHLLRRHRAPESPDARPAVDDKARAFVHSLVKVSL